MSLGAFIARRLLLVIPMLVGIVFATFMLVRVGGLDPVGLLAGPTATQNEIDLIRTELRLDEPLLVQFGAYLGNVLQGDLGESWLSGRPVAEEMLRRIPATLELLLLGVGLGALVGIPVGLRAAFHPGSRFDQVSRMGSLLGFSIPTYFLGLLMLFIFFYLLRWAPPGVGRLDLILLPPPAVTGSYLIDALLAGDMAAARSAAAHLVLPVLCIAIISAAPIIKHTRAIAIEVLSSDHVRFARASGLPRRAIERQVLRNSSVPVMTFVGTELTGLVGTASLIEFVFAWGGIGQYGLEAIVRGDFAVVQAYVLVLALFSVLVFLVIDIAVALIEPRAELR